MDNNINCNSFTVQFLERNLNKIENSLSIASAIPIVGTVTSLAKFALGGLLILGSVGIYGGSFVVSAFYWNNRKVADMTNHTQEHCKDYLKHGFVNLGTAVVEGIPVVGTIFFLTRYTVAACSDHNNPSAFGAWVSTGTHEFKIYPYRNLVAQDACVVDHTYSLTPSECAQELEWANRELDEYKQQAYCFPSNM